MTRIARLRIALISSLSILLVACGSHTTTPNLGVSQASPFVFQKQPLKLGAWVTTQLKSINGETAHPWGITKDANHKVWAVVSTKSGFNGIEKIAMDQKVTAFPLSIRAAYVTLGSDLNLWVTGERVSNGVVARVTTSGAETDFPITPGSFPGRIVSGPDGALWFSICSQDGKTGGIGRMNTSGSFVIFPGPCAVALTFGSDGNVWFGDGVTIYSMNTQGELLAQYPTTDHLMAGMATGSDGAVYVIGRANVTYQLYRVTMNGVVTNLGPDPSSYFMGDILSGPGGNLWITDYLGGKHYLTSFNPSTQMWGPHVLAPHGAAFLITVGPDNNIWMDSGEGIDTYILQAMTATPDVLTLAVGKQATVSVSESNYTGQWTAIANNPSIISVTPNSNDGAFSVTGLAPGRTYFKIYDTIFNSVKVKVTVQ